MLKNHKIMIEIVDVSEVRVELLMNLLHVMAEIMEMGGGNVLVKAVEDVRTDEEIEHEIEALLVEEA
jgi:hypothetical protein